MLGLTDYYSLVHTSFVVIDDAELHGGDDDDGYGTGTIKIIPMDYHVSKMNLAVLICGEFASILNILQMQILLLILYVTLDIFSG